MTAEGLCGTMRMISPRRTRSRSRPGPRTPRTRSTKNSPSIGRETRCRRSCRCLGARWASAGAVKRDNAPL